MQGISEQKYITLLMNKILRKIIVKNIILRDFYDKKSLKGRIVLRNNLFVLYQIKYPGILKEVKK